MSNDCNCHGAESRYSQRAVGTLERPRYSPGLILEDSDLTSAVEYTRSLNRLLFRNLFGCGVVCGLNVSVDPRCGLEVTVGAGLALDGCGDPIQLPKPIKISIDQDKRDKLEQGASPNQFWVVLCGREKLCAPRQLVCDADDIDGATQPTRVRANAEVSLVFGNEEPKCVCKCQKNPESAATAAARRADGQRTQTSTDDTGADTPCQYDHETNYECTDDCGCDTPCACGCCILLARIDGISNDGSWTWTPRHDGVRRFVRPRLLPDREPTQKRASQSAVQSSQRAEQPALDWDTTQRVLERAAGVAATQERPEPVMRAMLMETTVQTIAEAIASDPEAAKRMPIDRARRALEEARRRVVEGQSGSDTGAAPTRTRATDRQGGTKSAAARKKASKQGGGGQT